MKKKLLFLIFFTLFFNKNLSFGQNTIINNKLSGNHSMGNKGGDRNWAVSSDKKTVLFYADNDSDLKFDLYSVPFGGGIPVKLNENNHGGATHVLNRQITEDNKWVLYRADQDFDDVYQLYRVPIKGGTSLKITDGLPNKRSTTPLYLYLARSGTVYFIANGDTEDLYELYSVPITGGIPKKLNNTIEGEGDFLSLTFNEAQDKIISVSNSTNNKLSIYQKSLSDDGSLEKFELQMDGEKNDFVSIRLIKNNEFILRIPVVNGYLKYSAIYYLNLDKKSLVRLTPTLNENEYIDNGSKLLNDRVIYTIVHGEGDDRTFRTNSVSLKGGAYVELNSGLYSIYRRSSYWYSKDLKTLFFAYDNLYSIPVSGGNRIQLNPTLPEDSRIEGFQFNSRFDTIVYNLSNYRNTINFYSIPVVGGNPIKLINNMTPESSIGGLSRLVGDRFIYRLQQSDENVYELFSASINGEETIRLDGPRLNLASSYRLVNNPHNKSVMYWTRSISGDETAWYNIPVDGAVATKLTPDVVPGGSVLRRLGIYNKGKTFLYSARQDNADMIQLYTSTITCPTLDNSVIVDNTSLTASLEGVCYRWINCSTNDIVSGEEGRTFSPSETGDYAVELIEDGCIKRSDCFNIQILDVNTYDREIKLLKAYPNPTNDIIYFSDQIKKVTLFDNFGKILLITSNQYIDLTSMSTGLFFIKIETDKGNSTQQVIKY